MNTLTAEKLKKMIDRNEDFTLINVLSEDAFDEAHIPGSYNVPNERDSFLADVDKIVRNKSRQVVVYCASRDCTASPTAAKKLEKAGYTNVYDFEDGMAGWRLAGYDVESAVTAR